MPHRRPLRVLRIPNGRSETPHAYPHDDFPRRSAGHWLQLFGAATNNILWPRKVPRDYSWDYVHILATTPMSVGSLVFKIKLAVDVIGALKCRSELAEFPKANFPMIPGAITRGTFLDLRTLFVVAATSCGHWLADRRESCRGDRHAVTQARSPKPLSDAQGLVQLVAAAGCRAWQVVPKCAATQMEETRGHERTLAGQEVSHLALPRGGTTCGFGA